jgi:hypothetical protein
MSRSEETASGAYRLIAWTPFAIALALIVSMMPARPEWLYVAAVIGALASVAVGRTSGAPAAGSLQTRVWKFVRGWFIVVVLAALSILHGKWEPMVFFAFVGLVSTVLFWWACKSSNRTVSRM